MTRLSEKIIAVLLVLFLLVYAGYQFVQYYFSPVQYETAYQYTVTHSISTTGLILRDETVIDQQSSSGVENSVFADGTRVAKGQAVAEYYASSISDQQIQRMRQIEIELEALSEAQNPAVSNFSNAESINREIRDKLGKLSYMSSTGRFEEMPELQPTLVSLLNKKQIAIGKEADYQPRISQLTAEYQSLESGMSTTSVQVANAPVAGYFVKMVDGIENLSPVSVRSYSVEQFETLLENVSPSPSASMVGKIVTSEKWYLYAQVPQYDIQWLNPGWPVQLNFESVDGVVPGIVEDIITDGGEDDAVLIIRSNHVNGDILNLRLADVEIQMESYKGLRISTSSLRFQEEEQGVYVLSKNIVRFKKVDPIYEDTGYIISKESADSGYVQMFDQIITKGIDIYDGKVIE